MKLMIKNLSCVLSMMIGRESNEKKATKGEKEEQIKRMRKMKVRKK